MQKLTAQLSKLKGRDIFLLTFVLVALFTAVWYYFAYQTNRTAIEDARTRLQTLEAQVLTSRQANAELPALREQVALLETQRAELLRSLPATASMGTVLNEIRTNVSASGAELLGVTQANGQTAGLPAGVRPIGLNLTLDGQFGQLYGVLRSLEDMSRFSTINALALNLGTATSTDPTLSGTIGVTIYTFDPAAAQPAAAPAPTTDGTAPAPAAPAAPAPAAPAAPAGGSS